MKGGHSWLTVVAVAVLAVLLAAVVVLATRAVQHQLCAWELECSPRFKARF